mgnify:FL=1
MTDSSETADYWHRNRVSVSTLAFYACSEVLIYTGKPYEYDPLN